MTSKIKLFIIIRQIKLNKNYQSININAIFMIIKLKNHQHQLKYKLESKLTICQISKTRIRIIKTKNKELEKTPKIKLTI